jgi:hypothetical protein
MLGPVYGACTRVRVRTAHRKPAGRRRSPIWSSSRKPNLAYYSSCGPHADLATRGPPRWAADRQTAAQQRATCSSPHPEPAPERSCEILMNRDRLLGMHSLSTPVTQFQWRCAPSRYRCDGGHRGHGDVARRGRCVNWVPGRLSLAAGALCWHPVSPEGSPIRCGWRAWRVRPATAAPLPAAQLPPCTLPLCPFTARLAAHERPAPTSREAPQQQGRWRPPRRGAAAAMRVTFSIVNVAGRMSERVGQIKVKAPTQYSVQYE